MDAASSGHKWVVEVLLGRGAHLETKDNVRPPVGPYMRALPALTLNHLTNKPILHTAQHSEVLYNQSRPKHDVIYFAMS